MSETRPRREGDDSPRSFMRLLRTFDALASNRVPMTLAQLSVALEAPKSSVLLLLRAMVANGFITHDGEVYSLGPSIFRLAQDILAVRDFGSLIRPFLAELATPTQESVYLARLDRDRKSVVYVESIDSPRPVRYSVPVGTTRGLYNSAAGLALLSFQDDEWRESYLKTVKLERLTDLTITDRRVLRQIVEDVREQGVALSVGGAVDGAAGLAVPILDGPGPVEHALLVAAPVDRLKQAMPEVTELVKDVGRRASGLQPVI